MNKNQTINKLEPKKAVKGKGTREGKSESNDRGKLNSSVFLRNFARNRTNAH